MTLLFINSVSGILPERTVSTEFTLYVLYALYALRVSVRILIGWSIFHPRPLSGCQSRVYKYVRGSDGLLMTCWMREKKRRLWIAFNANLTEIRRGVRLY